jgi:ankyrin repeat protein
LKLGSGTALHFASRRGVERIVDLLIKAGADIHARNDLGESILALALPRKRSEIVRVLSRHGIEELSI